MQTSMNRRTPTPPPETIVVSTKRVSCDGGGGTLGHPKVFLEMGEGTQVECPYCDRLFVLKPGTGENPEH
jgi:uncharacterized Zn-finger protein